MRQLRLILSATLIISILSIPAFAANPKAGAICPKAGNTQIYAGKKFTCVKSGKKLVWNSGVVIKPTTKATPSPTPIDSAKVETIDWTKTYNTDNGFKYYYKNPCHFEDNIENQWRELQTAYFKFSNCIWPISVAKYELGSSLPKTNLNMSGSEPIEKCAISEPANSSYHRGWLNNWEEGRRNFFLNKKIPGPNMRIQIVPIFAEDTAAPKNSPAVDYKRFTDFIKEWAIYSSDVSGRVEVQIPPSYIKVNGRIQQYGITHEGHHLSAPHVKFNNEILKQVDPYIDFTGVNLAIFVVPANTPLTVLSQGAIGELKTNEGVVTSSSSQYPYTLDGFYDIRFKNLTLPYWWLHELYHVGFGLEHHDGDGLNQVFTEYGMGSWSLMSHGGSDLLAWDKWLVGFIGDNQINCMSATVSSTTWIAPSSVKTSKSKMTIVPISQFKVIVMESVRPAGLNYKLPETSSGVLVYEVDLLQNFLETGLRLVLPTNRDPNKGPFFLAEAPLRQGESVVTNGHRITVLESGNFGDVVKVEKA